MSFSASDNFIIVITVVVPRVCVCLFVVFCRHVHLDPDVRVHRGTENSFIYYNHPRNAGMTLLFAVLTKNGSFRSYSTFVYLLRAHILNINTCTYTTSAHGLELSGCVRADTYINFCIILLCSSAQAMYIYTCTAYDS